MRQTLNIVSHILPISVALGIFIKKDAELGESSTVIACIIRGAAKQLVLDSIFGNDIVKDGANVGSRMLPSDVIEGK